jgi:DNA-binding transcriptional LysR family regulator
MASGSVAQGALIPLFEDWQLNVMPMYVAYAPNRHISLKLRVFIDWIVELMAEQAATS